MTESQNVEPGPNPPQFNGLSAGTDVVSVTIGGNDIGFTEIIENCITYNPFSTPCKDKYDPGGHDQLAERIENAAPKVAAVLQGIHARSPNARVFVVNYPDDPADRQRLLADDAARPSPTCRTCARPRNGSTRCWRPQAVAERRDDRQLVRGERRPRRLQVELGPAGSNR